MAHTFSSESESAKREFVSLFITDPDGFATQAKKIVDGPPWLVLTNASSHMTNDRTCFASYSPIYPIPVEYGVVGRAMEAVGKGTVVMELPFRGETRFMVMLDVLHVPALQHNVVSAGKLLELGYSISSGGNGKFCISDGPVTVAEAIMCGGLYVLPLSAIKKSERLIVA